MCSGGYAPSGVEGQSPWSSNFKTMLAILRSGFQYVTFWCFQIFRPLPLTCYIWPIPMPLMQKHILDGKMNLLGAGSIMFEAICGSLLVLLPCVNSTRLKMAWITWEKSGWAFSWTSRSAGPCWPPHWLHSWCGRIR